MPRKSTISKVANGADYTDDEIDFMKAIDKFKRDRQKPRPTWAEVLEVARSRGWRKVAEPAELPGQ